MQNISKLNALTSLAQTAINMSSLGFSLAGLNGVASIANSISKQNNLQNSISNDLINTLNISQNNFALYGLSASLAQLAKQNQIVSDKLAGFAKSQLLVSSTLATVASIIGHPQLNQFSALNIVLQGITNAYLKKIATTKTWEDLDVVEEANEKISEIAKDSFQEATQITKSDLENFKTSIVNELSDLYSKCKTGKARKLILDIITVISFILAVRGTINEIKDISNREVVEETQREIKGLDSEISDIIIGELNKFNKVRISRTNVNLRYSTKKNSKILGLVKKGQLVTVIEIRHKHLLISYIDDDTKEQKYGFVVKKYFEELK